MSLPRAYLDRKLPEPLPTKDGGTLRTIRDASAYMVALSEDRALRRPWQRACELLLARADVADVHHQVKLALFMDARLELRA